MTQLRTHPAVACHAEATVAAIFAMPISLALRTFLQAYLLSTPAGREALLQAAEARLRAAFAERAAA